MAKMDVRFISGINSDRVEAKIFTEDGTIDKKEFIYGLNASYNRKNAEYAQHDYENALKYGWDIGLWHMPKPFVGDLLHDLIETYYVGNEDITYSGYMVYPQRDMTPEEVQKRVDEIAEEF